MKTAAVALVVAASQAQAQGSGSEGTLVLLAGPPTVLSLAIDIMLLSELVPNGTAGRGRSITALVFASVGATISGTMLAVGLGSFRPTDWWMGLSAGALAVAVGTLVLGIYGLIRGEGVEEQPEPLPKPAPRPFRPLREPEIPPQLLLFPLAVHS